LKSREKPKAQPNRLRQIVPFESPAHNADFALLNVPMLWPLLTIIVAAAALALHLWWRGRYIRSQRLAREREQAMSDATREAAAQSQAQQQILFDSMAEGLLLLDSDGRIQTANRPFDMLFGHAADLRGKTILEGLRLHELAELAQQVSVEGQVLDRELRLVRPVERWMQVNGVTISNAAGGRSTLLVFHDLTRLKKLENARTEFVGNVSHELRTPLSLIKGYAETLLSGAKDDPSVAAKFLQSIDRNADRLRLLIEDLLTISELESGRVSLNLRDVSLSPLIEKVLGDFKSRAQSRGVQFIHQNSTVIVRADAGRLEQVLGNLVDNAIKYGRTKGVVTVGAKRQDSQAEIWVQDDGPGIPAAALERVFERFFRVDKARSREQGGTGLGLAIVKHLVQSQGGKAWATSELGKGSSFYFTLPLAAAPTA
jgi:two-component system phosphate regulon sensor histidine kinase PhoR